MKVPTHAIVFAASLAFACSQAKRNGAEAHLVEASPGAKTSEPPTMKDAPLSVESVELKWTTKELAELGVRIDFVADRIVRESNIKNSRYAMQPSQGVSLGVVRGDKATLKEWATSLSASGTLAVSPTTLTTVCGAPARHQVGTLGPHAARGSRIDDKGQVVHLEPQQHDDAVVAIEVDLPNEKLLVSYRVSNDKRESLKAAEAHFFASIACL